MSRDIVLLVTAVVGDEEVSIYFPDGRDCTIPHGSRHVAGLFLADWVRARTLAWSDGRQTASPIVPDPRGAGVPASIARILDDAARSNTRLFSLHPVSGG